MLMYIQQGAAHCLALSAISDHLANTLPGLHWATTDLVNKTLKMMHFQGLGSLLIGGMTNGNVLRDGASSATGPDGSDGVDRGENEVESGPDGTEGGRNNTNGGPSGMNDGGNGINGGPNGV